MISPSSTHPRPNRRTAYTPPCSPCDEAPGCAAVSQHPLVPWSTKVSAYFVAPNFFPVWWSGSLCFPPLLRSVHPYRTPNVGCLPVVDSPEGPSQGKRPGLSVGRFQPVTPCLGIPTREYRPGGLPLPRPWAGRSPSPRETRATDSYRGRGVVGGGATGSELPVSHLEAVSLVVDDTCWVPLYHARERRYLRRWGWIVGHL